MSVLLAQILDPTALSQAHLSQEPRHQENLGSYTSHNNSQHFFSFSTWLLLAPSFTSEAVPDVPDSFSGHPVYPDTGQPAESERLRSTTGFSAF